MHACRKGGAIQSYISEEGAKTRRNARMAPELGLGSHSFCLRIVTPSVHQNPNSPLSSVRTPTQTRISGDHLTEKLQAFRNQSVQEPSESFPGTERSPTVQAVLYAIPTAKDVLLSVSFASTYGDHGRHAIPGSGFQEGSFAEVFCLDGFVVFLFRCTDVLVLECGHKQVLGG
jgi:hypothetical protein